MTQAAMLELLTIGIFHCRSFAHFRPPCPFSTHRSAFSHLHAHQISQAQAHLQAFQRPAPQNSRVLPHAGRKDDSVYIASQLH